MFLGCLRAWQCLPKASKASSSFEIVYSARTRRSAWIGSERAREFEPLTSSLGKRLSQSVAYSALSLENKANPTPDAYCDVEQDLTGFDRFSLSDGVETRQNRAGRNKRLRPPLCNGASFQKNKWNSPFLLLKGRPKTRCATRFGFRQ